MRVFLGIIIGLTMAYGIFVYQRPVIEAKVGYHWTRLTGKSMEQFGFYEGMRLQLLHRTPHVGDYVSFRCVNETCPQHNMLKRLVSQDEDCYWFQGRDDEWQDENGDKKHSLDSRGYGWVCKKDIVINGIIPHETHPQKAQVLVSERNLWAQPVCSSETQGDHPKTRILRGNATPSDIH